jgi:hypothetical protein
MNFAAVHFTHVYQPFEARKSSRLRVRDIVKFPHPEVPALAGLEGPFATNSDAKSQFTFGDL